MLIATLAERLGIEELAQRWCAAAEAAGRGQAGRKVMTLIYAMALGATASMTATCCARAARAGCWAAGSTAPSTLGTFCARSRSGTCASSTDCSPRRSKRAWKAGAGPGEGRLNGRCRQLRRRGPRLRQAGRGVRLHAQARLSPDPRHPGGDRRGAAHPPAQGLGEHLARDAALRRRADRARRARRRDRARSCCAPTRASGTTKVFARLAQAGWSYSIGVRLQPHVRAAIEQIDETAWQTLADYPPTGDGADRRTTLGRPAPDRATHPHARRPRRAVAQLAALPVR